MGLCFYNKPMAQHIAAATNVCAQLLRHFRQDIQQDSPTECPDGNGEAYMFLITGLHKIAPLRLGQRVKRPNRPTASLM